MFTPAWEGQIPSLGYAVASWIEQYCCHGPGDIQGEPVELDVEWLTFIVNAYRIDPVTGRRIYDEGVLSRPKGRAKSELAGFIGVAEAFSEEVRFDQWDDTGQPVGRRVVSPFLKCLATEESQAGNTYENIAFIVAEWGQEAHPEIYGGIQGVRNWQANRAIYLPDGGTILACTSGSASKDGGKETWVCADESHLYVLPELKSMYGTVRRNLAKRMAAEPWLLQTTTAYRPGEQSIAEGTLTAWRKGELSPSVLVDHRQAEGAIRLNDKPHTMAQIKQVYGAAAAWMDTERIYREMTDIRSCPDEATAARYYLNRPMSTKDAWIATDIVERQAKQDVVQAGTEISLGFDGSLNKDATVLIGCRMSDGFIFPIGIWACPEGPEANWWEVPRLDVLATIRETFSRYKVTLMHADPHEWRSDIDLLAEEFGLNRVVSWETRLETKMSAALDRLRTDLVSGEVWHSGDKVLMEHFANAYVRRRGSHTLVRKEHEGSSRKIDSLVGATLAYQARADVLAAGPEKKGLTRVVGRVRSY